MILPHQPTDFAFRESIESMPVLLSGWGDR